MSFPTSPSIFDEPLSPPPPGQLANFINPTSRAGAIYIAAGVCLPLIVLFAGLRFYAKLRLLRRKTWDDLTCALGLLGGISFICLTTAAVAGGAYGSHEWDVTIGKFTKAQLVLSLINEGVYGPSMWLIKLSLFVLYLEVFGLLKWLRYSAYAGMVLTGIAYFVIMIRFIVLCEPTNGHSRSAYLSVLTSPKCTSTHALILWQGILNVVSDLYLIALPFPALWSMQMPLRKKLGVAAVISTGLIACIASILGLSYRVQLIRSQDKTWTVIPVQVSSIVEMTAGILVCCMPTTNAVLNRMKGPAASFITAAWAFSSLVNRKTETKHELVESTPNLRYDSVSYQAKVVPRDKTFPIWSDSGSHSSDWLHDHENTSTHPLENIRKTTDIQVV